jgi:hypothetical protein
MTGAPVIGRNDDLPRPEVSKARSENRIFLPSNHPRRLELVEGGRDAAERWNSRVYRLSPIRLQRKQGARSST